MLDLSAFAEPLLPDDPRLAVGPSAFPPPARHARQGVHWWLVREGVEGVELLQHLLPVFQRGGWRRVTQEKLNFLLEGPDGRLLVQVDDAPCREVSVMSMAGEEHHVVRWPDAFEGRVVVLVKMI
jgi:hypothetical protein